MERLIWQLILSSIESEIKGNPVMLPKSDLNCKYLWECELSEGHLERKQKTRSLRLENEEAKKLIEAAQKDIKAEFDGVKQKSTSSQEEVNHLNKKLNSAQKAK